MAQAGPRARRAGHVLFKLKSSVKLSETETQEKIQRRGFQVRKTVGPKSFMARRFKKSNLVVTEEQMAQELMDSGLVEYAEPDYLQYPNSIETNDPDYVDQWMHEVMFSESAWQQGVFGEGIVYAICDSGVDASHPDLAGQVLTGFNTVSNNTDTSPATTHGTKIAGLVAAKMNNSYGIIGVAPGVKILPGKLTNSSSGSAYLSEMAECIRMSADRGAKVINLSYTGANSKTIDDAAQYARSKGSLLFMSAGNQGVNRNSWDDFDSFVLVGATDSSDQMASFSNYGTPLDLFAPGSRVLTTSTNASFTTISGTSFASPIAAAVAALVWSVNPDFTPDQIEEILFQSADYLGDEQDFGHGRVNIDRAIAQAFEEFDGNRAPSSVFQLNEQRILINESVLFNGSESSDDGTIKEYRWEFSDGTILFGKKVSISFSQAGEYQVKLIVSDESGKIGVSEKEFKVYSSEAPLMFVENIRMVLYYSFWGRSSSAKAYISVANEEGNFVANATVKVRFHDGSIKSVQTNSEGIAEVRGDSQYIKNTHTVEVLEITSENGVYDANLNQESEDSIRYQGW